MVRYINCTGFPAVIWSKINKDEIRDEHVSKDDEYERPILVIDADQSYTISLQREYQTIGMSDGVPVKIYAVTGIKGMPEQVDGVVYIVTQQILDYINQYTTRTDFVCLTDKVNKRFDKHGNIIHGKVPEGTEFTVRQVGYRSFCLGNVDDIGDEQIYDVVEVLTDD